MTNNISIGGGFTSLLTIVFVIAKLFGGWNVSWWIVFSPIWISLLILAFILFLIGFVSLIIYLVKK